MKEKTKVTSIVLPVAWVDELKSLARKKSAEHNKDISFSKLIRRAVKKVYKSELKNVL